MTVAGLTLSLIVCFLAPTFASLRAPRSIDLSATHALISDSKLPGEIIPNNYTLDLRPNIDESIFSGKVKIVLTWQEPTNKITLHASNDLEIADTDIKLFQIVLDDSIQKTTPEGLRKPVTIKRVDRLIKKPILIIYLTDSMKQGSVCELEIEFSGSIWESSEGLFKGGYLDITGEKRSYLATQMRPNNARRLFPCFDEPSYKVPFTVSISRPKNFTTLFNTDVKTTDETHDHHVIDYFETTPPMSTFTFGFVMSQLTQVQRLGEPAEQCGKICVKIWARPDIHMDLNGSYDRVEKVLIYLQNYLAMPFPMKKLDIVVLPGFVSVKPIDNWGLIVYKESEMLQPSYYILAQEMTYQWLGALATPYWWSDSHINKAIVGFLSVSASMNIDGGAEFEGKWPMTTLYSIYYEFSKRYPHSRITGMKQETICAKTELVLRMLNLTLGHETFQNGLQKFIVDREYRTFFADDIWEALTKQAHLNGKLCTKATIGEIANSWVTKDRIPVVSVIRDYSKSSANVTQKLYLRERPHDVPEQDKMLWWIPLVVVTQDSLNFSNFTPYKWIKNVKEVELTGLPSADKFIIVNPEEIGPFPVNYDEKNWNLLSEYLQTETGRNAIPVYTRAKLLHDAWNLAYSGQLSFAIAFDMTLFMKHERHHIVWNPVFTFIDHIGRHIDMSSVHKKFEQYVSSLLAPLYEELGSDTDANEESWKVNLRSLSKTFLCRAGYKPCIQEAQNVYKRWMDSPAPDEGNPVPNQYLCPVFKWGTNDEWEFGLQRVINFPSGRKQSERTYLLKTLAGCPNQREKIQRLLNITIIEENGNFTENDVFLTFNMLAGSSLSGKALFSFLQDNFDLIKTRFTSKTNLWDNLISTATGSFTTQEGYDLVSQLYVQKQGEFGSAEHIIEKSLKNIKEETKWSDENLPVIEKWLDSHLKSSDFDESKFMA
jgi:hypothetical protein